MRTIKQIFNGTLTLQIAGKYLRIIDAATSVDVTFYRNGSQIYDAHAVGSGFYALPDGGFDRIDIANSVSQSVKIAISSGEGGYDVVSVVGSVSASITLASTLNDAAPVSVGVAATVLLAANANRTGARFFNAGAADVYLGSATVTTANGAVKIKPGETWLETEAPGAPWYGISATAAQSVRIQEAIK